MANQQFFSRKFLHLNILNILLLISIFIHVVSGLIVRSSDPVVYDQTKETIIGGGTVALGQADNIATDKVGAPLNPDDFNYGNGMLDQPPAETHNYQIDPIEIAGLYEGDINVTREDEVKIREANDPKVRSLFDSPNGIQHLTDHKKTIPITRTAVDDLRRKWPNGVVPYVISSSYDKYQRGVIAKAFTTISNVSCIRFVPRSQQVDYIHILQGDGCFSSVGRIGEGQVVSIGLLCITIPMVMHELMHALGFWHEQSRPDRDQYITIIWDNIQPGMKKNFDKSPWTADTLDIPYDAKSIMHYKPYAFSKNRKVPNGNPTITSKTPREMGQRRNIEKSDIKKMNIFYQCESLKTEITHPIDAFPAGTGECLDQDEYCLLWKTEGECIKNPAYMLIYCKKSCGLCQDPNANPNACEDESPYCNSWSNNFQCIVNPRYMNIYCKKSCNQCNMSNGLFK